MSKHDRPEQSLSVMRVADFGTWRDLARPLLANQVHPALVHFIDSNVTQSSLFDTARSERIQPSLSNERSVNISRALMNSLAIIALHRDAQRWQLMYSIAFRILYSEPNLLYIESDAEILQMRRMEAQVQRDAHKMKAFVRFRKTMIEDQEHYVAYHRPDHYIVRMTAPFFADRFKGMHWTILTPDLSVSWNMQQLQFGPGVAVSEAPKHDDLEAIWLTYYRSIFNPARIKWNAMVKEMPVRHWATLPETSIIDDLLAEAPARVNKMIQQQEGFQQSAADYIPSNATTLDELRKAATGCRGCPLWEPATQTVFGVGSKSAKIVLVGEQPGDNEDLQGKPFVGPAGQILEEAFEEVGLSHKDVYITNSVKHFKFQQRGKLRLHVKPGAREMTACKPWLLEEIRLIQPLRLVCLGATAAQAIIGRGFSITKERGKVVSSDLCPWTMATYHPAAILRVPDKERARQMRAEFVSDLAQLVSNT